VDSKSIPGLEWKLEREREDIMTADEIRHNHNVFDEPDENCPLCKLYEAAPDMYDVAGEADTLTQAICELLRDFADDNWAADLKAQAEALGHNARAAIAKAKAKGETE
jgi:hypothetical protein